MDILKQELLKKRQSLSGGRKVFKRSEMEQKQNREEEKRDAEAKRLCENQNPNLSDPKSKPDSIMCKPESGPGSSSTIDEQSVNLSKQEVTWRLRLLKQPVTLFGENEIDRLDRLKKAEIDDDKDMAEGQTNDYLVELKRWKRRGDDDEDDDKNYKRIKKDFSNLCDEDKIVVFFQRLLIEWKQELDKMTETEKKTAKGKSAFATYKQCKRYLNPLFKSCRKKVLRDDIRQALMLVVECCIKGDYLHAEDHYIRIAIGNSAWPIGVTMVGIHERSAREKIHTMSIAHVMNDETTRKYLTSVKRLITFCRTRHPTMPFQTDSLANASVLQGLLA